MLDALSKITVAQHLRRIEKINKAAEPRLNDHHRKKTSLLTLVITIRFTDPTLKTTKRGSP
jgi:hypothetical protein